MIDRRIYHLCHEGLLFATFWLDLVRGFVVFFLSRTKNVDLQWNLLVSNGNLVKHPIQHDWDSENRTNRKCDCPVASILV